METAGDLVAVAAELAAGVQHGEHDLGRALALVRAGRIRIDRNAAPVVVDTAAAVGEQRDRDARAEARHRLVDGVVDDLPDRGGGGPPDRWTRCTFLAVCGPGRDPPEPGCLWPRSRPSACWCRATRAPQSIGRKSMLDLRFYWRRTSWLPALQLLSRSVSILPDGCDTKAAIRRRSARDRGMPRRSRSSPEFVTTAPRTDGPAPRSCRSWRRRLRAMRCFSVGLQEAQLASPTPGRRPRRRARCRRASPASRERQPRRRRPRPTARTRRPSAAVDRASRRRSRRCAASGRRLSRLSPIGTGSRLTTSPCQLRCARSRRDAAASARTPGGGQHDLAGGRCEERLAPLGSSSLSTSSSTSTGALPASSVTSRWARQSQRQRQRALLALGRVGARRHAVDEQLDIVAVRPDARHAAAHVVGARLGQRACQTAWRHGGS